MRRIVLHSAQSQRGDEIGVTPYLFDYAMQEKPTEFGVTFIENNVRYEYGFISTNGQILEEWLFAYPKGRPQVWIERTFDSETQQYKWGNTDKLVGTKQLWQESTRSNALFLSTAIQLNNTQLRPVFDWFKFQIKIIGGNLAPSFTAELIDQEQGDPLYRKGKEKYEIYDYKIINKFDKEEWIYSPHKFPDDGSVKEVYEPWTKVSIISPSNYLGAIMQLLYEHEAEVGESESFGDGRTHVALVMPLRELMRNFFDDLKSVTSGYASISYEIGDTRTADVVRLDILVNDDPVIAFASVVSRRRAQEEAEKSVEKLALILPRQQIAIKIQARAIGRILSSKTLSGFRKDVTQHMYGGDITRKMKLREKQKKGKKKMQATHKVHIPEEVFVKMMRRGES